MAGKQDVTVIRRRLGAATVAGLPVIEALRCHDGRARIFFGTGTRPEIFQIDGTATTEELRDIAGGTMAVLPASEISDSKVSLALRCGALARIPLGLQETALFDGLDTQLAFRLEEPAATVAEGLLYHARHHGMKAALIVNRAPWDSPSGTADVFAAALEAELAGSGLTVLILDCPVPLGRPDIGPENDLYLAPDAPGRDRMTAPGPDPWRSPLGATVLHEALKWRFLARARAVLALDVTDVLAPRAADDPTAFDLCRSARRGVVLLVGRRIYPWRVRPGRLARFGDHICRQFDGRRGIARWGVAPDIAGLDATWRTARVAFARPDRGIAIPFFRAMAVRVPGRASAELAPKSSLIEDPVLLQMSQSHFGHRPVRAPVSRPKSLPPDLDRTAIITTMKNEGPFILEWLAYHRAIGVKDFLIYTNDCTDGTDSFLDLLQEKGIVQHRTNPFRDMRLAPQHAALQAAEDEPALQQAGWVICMDVDEFLNIKIGDGTLQALFTAMEGAMPGANMISATWRLFGNAGIHRYEDRLLVEQFDRCAPEIIRKPHQAWGFKTLFRNCDLYRKFGVHRPKGLRPDLWTEVRWLNGSGRPMPAEMFRNGWRSTLETYGYDWVALNHYSVRSAESFLVKRDRGRVNHVDRDQGLNYWFRMNHNAERDRSIQRMLPALTAERDRLLSDPQIAAMHEACVVAHRDRIAQLRNAEAPAMFFAELTSPRMERLCQLQHHFGSAVFNEGPGVIPADLPLDALPPGFFFTVAETRAAERPA